MSYDDGVTQDTAFIKLLNSLGLKCTFNINSALLGQGGTISYTDMRCGTPIGRSATHQKINGEELKTIYAGHAVDAHTLHHINLLAASDEDVLRETEEDRDALEALFGKRPSGLAYPGGSLYDERVIKLLKERTDLKYARNTDAIFFSDLLGGKYVSVKDTLEKYGDSAFDLPKEPLEWRPTCHNFYDERFELVKYYASLDREEDSVLMIWGHSYEFDMFPEWMEEQERFFRYVSCQDLDFVTCDEIFE